MSPKNKYIKTFKNQLVSLLWAVFLALLIRSLIFEPFKVPSSSMKPNLLIGDYIIVNKFAYGYSKHSFPLALAPFKGRILEFDKPKRGDVVVFRSSTDIMTFYVKRIVGLPGDIIQMVNGVLYINDKPMPKIYRKNFTDDEYSGVPLYQQQLFNQNVAHSYETIDLYDNGPLDYTAPFHVPAKHYFMMGDNRDGSNDSRLGLGYIKSENILGKVEFVFFSLKSSFFELWKWPTSIRYDRLFKKVK